MFTVVNVQTPSSVVHCKLEYDSWNTLVSGLDLNAGRMCIHLSTAVFLSRFLSSYILSFYLPVPPAKPQNVRCETWRSSPVLECSWERGWETHLSTIYNVSISRCGGRSQCVSHHTARYITAHPAKPLCRQRKRNPDAVGCQKC